MDAAEFHEVIGRGEVEAVRRGLDADPNLLSARSDGLTPLFRALFAGREEVVEMLLDRGAPVDAGEAAALGSVARLEAAFGARPDHGAVNAAGDTGWTPLHLAAFMGHQEAVEWLLDRGADPAARSGNHMANTPLHAALAGRGEPAVVRALLDRGADPGAQAAGGATPLHVAASRGDAGAVDLLVARGASPEPMEDGRMPSALAREREHPELADRLEAMEAGRDAPGR